MNASISVFARISAQCHEWPAVRMWCKKRKLTIADDFLLRYGSEARKFNKLPIFCSQSGNTKALGLEGMGDFLENFLLIRLQRVATKYAKNLPDQSILQRLKTIPYSMLVGEEIYRHPTHGHHTRVYKGATPINLKPLNSLPLTIPLAGSYNEPMNRSGESMNHPSEPMNRLQDNHSATSRTDASTSEPSAESTPRTASDRLELLRELRAKGLNKEQCILELWGVKKGGSSKYQLASEMYESMIEELRRLYGDI